MLITKCILAPVEEEDGLRISVMSRHTFQDGKTPDNRITKESFYLHYPQFAPTPKLIGAYLRKEISWEVYEERFREQLSNPTTQRELWEIAYLARHDNFTFLCIEDSAEHCHRRILAEVCAELVPGLIIEHR
ncbi:MAG: DUF488 domain-containing protein [Candidatus Paceibacterota bacterium]|jgi:uncharacterized protein YeaO (DUF488 family)